MKPTRYLLFALLLGLCSCDLVEPGDIENPNVSEDDFLSNPGAMKSWVNGAQKTFATNLSEFITRDELISDNYFNNYTRLSNILDKPSLAYTDDEVEDLQRCVGAIREAATYGLNTVARHDDATTTEQLFTLQTMRAYAMIMAGESFTALPISDGGEPRPWREHLDSALVVLNTAEQLAPNDSAKAYVETLRARTYYKKGMATEAAAAASRALTLQPRLIWQVQFDGANNVVNTMQTYTWDIMFQPLPRLDFLDPKYFQTYSTEQRPITIAKAEESYLILAEALLAQGKADESRTVLHKLLSLVSQRPVQTGINDQTEKRYNGGFRRYPNSADYRVQASAQDSLRSGLVVDRRPPLLISIPYISGTSVTDAMVDASTTDDSLLELIYLLRQEIFFAEGRRTADLGIRIPLCDVEAAPWPSATAYTTAVIPAYIPLNQGMDDFTLDEDARTVTIAHNMNRVLVSNRATAFAK